MNGKGSRRRPQRTSEADLQARWAQTFNVSPHSLRCYGTGCACTYTEHHPCGCVEHYQGDTRTDQMCPRHRTAA